MSAAGRIQYSRFRRPFPIQASRSRHRWPLFPRVPWKNRSMLEHVTRRLQLNRIDQSMRRQKSLPLITIDNPVDIRSRKVDTITLPPLRSICIH